MSNKSWYNKIDLTNNSILIFPDSNQHYMLYTDTSKHSWSGVLIQKKVVQINSEDTTSFVPITYIDQYWEVLPPLCKPYIYIVINQYASTKPILVCALWELGFVVIWLHPQHWLYHPQLRYSASNNHSYNLYHWCCDGVQQHKNPR